MAGAGERGCAVSAALPVGLGYDRLRLWDRYYLPLWDSATATTPAYQHIATWVNATIQYPDGTHWHGQLIRTPNGIERWSRDDIVVLEWPVNRLIDVVAI